MRLDRRDAALWIRKRLLLAIILKEQTVDVSFRETLRDVAEPRCCVGIVEFFSSWPCYEKATPRLILKNPVSPLRYRDPCTVAVQRILKQILPIGGRYESRTRTSRGKECANTGFRIAKRMAIIFSGTTKRRFRAGALNVLVCTCDCVRALRSSEVIPRLCKRGGNGVDHVDLRREGCWMVLERGQEGWERERKREGGKDGEGEARFSTDRRIPKRGHVPWK